MKRPYTVLFSTITVDGRIASSTWYSELSCPFDKARLRLLRGYVEAVMVGANTILRDNPSLSNRLEPRTEKYYRIVIDGRLRLAEHSSKLRLFSEPGPPVIIFTGIEKHVARLGKAIVVRAGKGGRVNLAEALSMLVEDYGVRSLLVEGGGVLAYNMVEEKLLDEVRITIAPFIFASGRTVFEDPLGRGFTSTKESPELSLKCFELCPCGRCMHLVYSLKPCCPPEGVLSIPYCLSNRLLELVEASEMTS